VSDDKKPLNFEVQIEKLEVLVAQLENGNLSLEDSIKAYEEGVKIAQACQATLKNAEQKVEILTKQGEELVKQDFNTDEF
jgi:exodeoxyribonuclease VII small subunit